MSILNDELFALRIGLQDTLLDESQIIRESKLYLLKKNIKEDDIDQIIVDFYKSFGVEFSNDFISNIQLSSTPFLLTDDNPNYNLYNNGVSSNNTNTDNAENLNINETTDESYDTDEYIDSGDELVEEANNIDNIPEPPNISFDQFIQSDNPAQYFNISMNNNTTYSNIHSTPNFENINPQNPHDFLNTFNNLINSLNIPTSTMDDVKVTLDESDLDKIEETELTEDLTDKCSICIMSMKKGEKYSKLLCGHCFHKDCITQWLKQYNYRCPVCRKECGQAKYHI